MHALPLSVDAVSRVMLVDVSDLLDALRQLGLEHKYALAKADILR